MKAASTILVWLLLACGCGRAPDPNPFVWAEVRDNLPERIDSRLLKPGVKELYERLLARQVLKSEFTELQPILAMADKFEYFQNSICYTFYLSDALTAPSENDGLAHIPWMMIRVDTNGREITRCMIEDFRF